MIETMSEARSLVDKGEERLAPVLEKLLAAAQPGAVFSEPVACGSNTLILVSEVAAGGGFGSGLGFGPTPPAAKKSVSEEAHKAQNGQEASGGGGFGGGGGSRGRPVAVIIAGPEKVTVQPVVDITRIALMGIGAWITMLTVVRKLPRGKPGKRERRENKG